MTKTSAYGRPPIKSFIGWSRGALAIAGVIGLAAGSAVEPRVITIVSGTYGQNCGVPRGNATSDFARQCEGRVACNYELDRVLTGDPAVGCQKNFLAEWRCTRSEFHIAMLSPEAGAGSVLMLNCAQERGAGK
jgi:hypothetical protein